MKIDFELLIEKGLNINEYLDLKWLYDFKINNECKFLKLYNLHLDLQHYESLQYIKIIENEYELRNKIRNLFEGNKDLFLTFLTRFPIKTPSGRYLSTKNEDTIKGKELRKKWNKLFKNNFIAAQKAIDVLDAEMEWRRKNGKFEFMHNAITWLNQGDFQNYEYLLREKKQINTKLREDYE